ncbi:MerR family transcriptional regulator [Streptococcus mutans]|uniref:MerR family transcriptional regulator n=1 Tax=Streptococcus mutans TaxID=1309 RepID=UPI0028ED5E1C|nr:MerR family transcriptional regulator [Streptococcus mutans]MDT9514272.1 MerR family transcriptional regulator [Streptococcus mutans]MDT9530374.1 MerR family transcriptional regulator [Streptococcus mutans]
MRIGEVSKLTNVSMRSLRYYEEKGLIHPERLENGYRDYDKLTLERIKTLKLYFDLGLTTAEMQQVMGMGCDPFVFPYKNFMCKDVIMIYEDKLKEVSHQIQILQQIESRLKERLMKIYHLKEDGINERY